MDYPKLKKHILSRLKNELNEELHYHSVEHTIDVLEATKRLAAMEGVNGHDMELLKTAAIFHDLGFVETYDGHEKAAMKMADEILPKYGYSKDEIALIKGMIRSTELPQKPSSHLEEIMADADLDYLGRDDLFVIGQRLQYEWKLHGIISTLREWHEIQLDFIKNHKFYTSSAKMLRNTKKQENIRELEILLGLK